MSVPRSSDHKPCQGALSSDTCLFSSQSHVSRRIKRLRVYTVCGTTFSTGSLKQSINQSHFCANLAPSSTHRMPDKCSCVILGSHGGVSSAGGTQGQCFRWAYSCFQDRTENSGGPRTGSTYRMTRSATTHYRYENLKSRTVSQHPCHGLLHASITPCQRQQTLYGLQVLSDPTPEQTVQRTAFFVQCLFSVKQRDFMGNLHVQLR